MTRHVTQFFRHSSGSSLVRSILNTHSVPSSRCTCIMPSRLNVRGMSTQTTFYTKSASQNTDLRGTSMRYTSSRRKIKMMGSKIGGLACLRPYSTEPSPPTRRENIYTIPNLLTVSRILACPVLGWSIVQGDFGMATGILAYAGITDLLDGYIARRYNSGTVLGSILDPAADKTLMTTLVISLAYEGMLPVPLAIIILGRDVLLSISAFYYRWISLPPPKTMTRYWDFSIPSAEVRPTQISKYNTFLQLILMGSTTISPLLGFDASMFLRSLQWVVGGTTVWSGLSYVFSKNAVKILSNTATKHKP